MIERDLVFIGGGHTHALVLRMLAMKAIENVRLTLISDCVLTPYSGMLPGYIAGHYSLADTQIDLNRLCNAGNVRFIQARVSSIDLKNKRVLMQDRAAISYDKLSINTGSTPNLTVEGAKEFALGVKPISDLNKTWQALLSKSRDTDTPHWAVVGGGAAGVEVVLAIAHKFKTQNEDIKLSLVQGGTELLPGYRKGTQLAALKALEHYNVKRVINFRVARVEEHQLVDQNHNSYGVDKSIWCTPAAAPSWPQEAGLAVSSDGFIAVNEFLQSTSHADVFACGDVASLTQSPRPKAGVYAVRSAPFLEKNLRAAFSQRQMVPINLQTDFLSLVSLGGKFAIGQRSGLHFSGNWVWQWKNKIDQKFMRLFDDKLPSMSVMDQNNSEPMHCAGCGSKIGPELLGSTLKELNIYPQTDLNVDLTIAEDAAVALKIDGQAVLQSIDGFRAFTDDLYRLGVVATHHAVNDLYAMGVQPTSAQVWANLEFSHPRLIQRDFKQMMSGITDTLLGHQTTLVGGHSTEGLETHLALVINGKAEQQWPKNNIQPGDWLLLNKPIGSGIILAANMQNKAPPLAIEQLWKTLLQSNREFFLKLKKYDIHAATDVTGFGLIGHLLEMLKESACSIQINSAAVPLISGTLELSRTGIQSSLLPQLQPLLLECEIGTLEQESEQSSEQNSNQNVEQALINCLLDPQTNGGLLVSVPEQIAKQILLADSMDTRSIMKIGEVSKREGNKKSLIIV